MEDQCRLGFLGAADALRAQWQTIYRDCIRAQWRSQGQARQFTGGARPAPRHGALSVWTVMHVFAPHPEEGARLRAPVSKDGRGKDRAASSFETPPRGGSS